MFKVITLFAFILAGTLAHAAGDHAMPAPKTNAKFEQMKKMVGTWEGKKKMGDTEQSVTATYELTSGGNVIIEKLFAGTPHEMISVYHAEGNTVAMTHYCMMGNQPKMIMKKSDDKSMAFEMTGTTGVKSMKEPHMHAMNVKWTADNAITEEWLSVDGAKKETTTLTLTKKN